MTNIKRVAVLGGGNSAHAMAADLALKGFEVSMCESPEFRASFSTTLERQAITMINPLGEEKTAHLRKATTDFEEAIKNVDYIMLLVPAAARQHFFSGIMPHLEDGMTIVIWAGNYSGLLLANMMKAQGRKKDVTIAETHMCPWAARLVGPATVREFIDVSKLLVAALPAKNTAGVVDELNGIYPLVPGENILAPSLNNLNPIVHVPGSVLNAAWVDTLKQDFFLYKFGTTLSVARVIKAVYEEVARTGDAVGAGMLEYPEEAFWRKSTIMTYYAKAPGDMEETAAKVSGPSSMEHRYITEDVPYGLVPVSQLAQKFGVAVPVIDGLIDISGAINRADYRREGMSLGEMGIADLSKDELARVLEEGF